MNLVGQEHAKNNGPAGVVLLVNCGKELEINVPVGLENCMVGGKITGGDEISGGLGDGGPVFVSEVMVKE